MVDKEGRLYVWELVDPNAEVNTSGTHPHMGTAHKNRTPRPMFRKSDFRETQVAPPPVTGQPPVPKAEPAPRGKDVEEFTSSLRELGKALIDHYTRSLSAFTSAELLDELQRREKSRG